VTTQDLVARLKTAAGSATAGLARLASNGAEAARAAWERLMPSAPAAAGGGPLDPLSDNAPPLPGTSDRAFRIGLVLVCLSVVSGLATYLLLTGLTPFKPQALLVVSALLVNLVLVIAMMAVIAVQVAGLRRAWKQKVPGARLHARIVALFSVIAALPALLLAFAAHTTFSRALDSWFNRDTVAIVQETTNIGKAYLLEHGQGIRTDAINMARDLDEAASRVAGDVSKFRDLVIAHATLRDLPAAYILDAEGAVRLQFLADERVPYRTPPPELIALAEQGQVPLTMPAETPGLEDEDILYEVVRAAKVTRVGAIAKLHGYVGLYLYVARGVDPKVVRHLLSAERALETYDKLKDAHGFLLAAFAVMYFMITLTALSAAIWVGLWFAGLFVAPIRRLIGAAQEVARGNLKVELPIRRGEGDLRRLSVNFNAMTKELESQRTELVNTNRQLSERRLFMEAVLSGVSAGVIGLDRNGAVTLASGSAEKLLACKEADLKGLPLAGVVPEFAALVNDAADPAAGSRRQKQVTLVVGGEERNFSVRITEQAPSGEEGGWVVTFDDITELVSAQRTSAWADVARRIAHEIKNPLTPIQLSAERIKRKYGKVITEDREIFERCTETIIRQVGDVTRMVDEFSAFARSPKPQMEDHDIRDVVKAAVLDRQMAGADVAFDTRLPREPIVVTCDRRLISQAVINLVKNAQEAIQQHAESVARNPGGEPGWAGRIETVVRRRGDLVDIEVIDNGPGLPKQNRTRLTEPYVTTKGAKGTGLGLAIVQKSVEQHNGALALEDAPPAPGRTHGALVRISLPARPAPQVQEREPHPEPAAAAAGGRV
jgi:two-component system nitrogen regulation sensor histidine kinase NtrY